MSKDDQIDTSVDSPAAALEEVQNSSTMDKGIVEEAQSRIEEKLQLEPSDSKRKEGAGDDPTKNFTADTNAPTESRSLNTLFSLRESQKKALKAFRLKVEAALSKAKAAAVKLEDTPTKEKQFIQEPEKIEDETKLVPSESKGSRGEGARMLQSETSEEGSKPASDPSFREESYKVEDLSDFEKKALEAFRLKVEDAIKSKTFFDRPTQKTCPESAVEAVKLGKSGEAGDQPVSEVPELKLGIAMEELPAYAVQKDLKEDDNTQAVTEREVVVIGERVPVDSPQSLYLWNIPIHNGDERTDVILMKFLRAKDFKVNAAFNMLKSTMSWRKEFVPDSVIKQESDQLIVNDQQLESLVFVHGQDKEGHPVCYNHYGVFQNKEMYHKLAFDGDDHKNKLHKLLRWRIQGLEKGLQKLDFTPGSVHSMVQVIDLGGSPATFLFKRPRITKKAVSLLQDHYPELVAKQIVVNAPWYFPALHAVFSRVFTPAREMRKVVLARPGKTTETLFKYISPENVPTKYGGLSRDPKSADQKDDPATQIIIKPGEQRAIELPAVEGGASLVWELSIVGWDVIYREEFCPIDESDYSLVIHKSRMMSSKSDPIRRSFTAPTPGKVLLIIDNSASKRKKIAVYRSSSTTPIAANDC